jgi:6-phosphofructokinase 1
LLDDGNSTGKDASGNPILKDIGLFLRGELKKFFKEADIKYIVS